MKKLLEFVKVVCNAGAEGARARFFLDDMVEEGVLEFELKTGKGGHHRVYFPAMKPKQFKSYVIKAINDKLKEVFASSRR